MKIQLYKSTERSAPCRIANHADCIGLVVNQKIIIDIENPAENLADLVVQMLTDIESRGGILACGCACHKHD